MRFTEELTNLRGGPDPSTSIGFSKELTENVLCLCFFYPAGVLPALSVVRDADEEDVAGEFGYVTGIFLPLYLVYC